MNEDKGTIVSQLENLGSSLYGVAEKLGRVDRELGEAKSQLGPQIQAVQSFLADHAALLLGPSPSAGPEVGQINEAVQKLVLGEDQEQILEVFLEETERHVDRAILFLQKDESYTPWKSLGFPSVSIESVEASSAEDPIVRAARQQRILYRAEGVAEAFPWLHQAGDLPRVAVCIPLVFGDSVPVVFYGDAARGISLDSLELLSHVTTLVLKNHYLQALLQSSQAKQAAEPAAEFTAPPAPAPVEAPPAEAPPPPPEPIAPPAFPSAFEAETAKPDVVETEEEAESPPEPEPVESFTPPEPAMDLPSLADETAEEAFSLEAVDEESPESEIDAYPEPEVDELVEAGGDDPLSLTIPDETTWDAEAAEEVEDEPAAEPWDESSPHHNEARRFARLLVSEIMLYNEEAVERGRQERDLYHRLRADIDRSRAMYQKRVHPSVQSSVDHFHTEVVRVLAGGQQERLGADYPGVELG